MDVGQIILEGVVAIASGAATAAAFAWKLSSKLTSLEEQNKNLTEDLKKLEDEVAGDRKTGAEQWRELNYTLGQIDGMMKGAPPPPRLGGR
jgi:hypothetical protein